MFAIQVWEAAEHVLVAPLVRSTRQSIDSTPEQLLEMPVKMSVPVQSVTPMATPHRSVPLDPRHGDAAPAGVELLAEKVCDAPEPALSCTTSRYLLPALQPLDIGQANVTPVVENWQVPPGGSVLHPMKLAAGFVNDAVKEPPPGMALCKVIVQSFSPTEPPVHETVATLWAEAVRGSRRAPSKAAQLSAMTAAIRQSRSLFIFYASRSLISS